MRGELASLELQRGDAEGQLQQLQQRQEGEAMALRSVQKLQEERRLLQERLGSLQRALAQLEAEKRDLERSALQFDKDRVALRKTLDKVEREKLRSHEDTLRLNAERGRLDRTLTGAELDLAEAQQQIQHLEAQVDVALEGNHNPVQPEAGEQQLELQQEVERLRSAQVQTERTLEARERAHRQRVSGLEEQVSTLKAQLHQELRRSSASVSLPPGTPEK